MTTISGMITTVDVPEPNEVIFQDRFVKAVFDFGQGSTLVMFGNSSYPADSSGADELAINAPVKKPIVGGTENLVALEAKLKQPVTMMVHTHRHFSWSAQPIPIRPQKIFRAH